MLGYGDENVAPLADARRRHFGRKPLTIAADRNATFDRRPFI